MGGGREPGHVQASLGDDHLGACRGDTVPGLLAFIAAQILAALGVVVVVSMTNNWHAFGHFFATVTAPALTGVLAAIAVTMGLGGFTTLRRVTI